MAHFNFSLIQSVRLYNFLLVYLLFTLFIGAESYAQNFPNGFSKVRVSFGFEKPTALAFAPDGRIFVAEKLGNVRVIKDENLLSTNFISLNVSSSGERGLIGIALDPDFAVNQYIYLHYTLPDASRNRISRFTANGNVAVPGSEVVILDLDPLSSASVHNGGAIHFGPDGKLYVAVGENSSPNKAQDLNTYHGKILRINPDGSVPSDNPFPTGSDQQRRVWAYGLRNPFTFDIQPGTGKIFVNDVGQSSWEEINDATISGQNFGWPTAEGNSSNNSFVNPVYTYPHGSGNGTGCAITGGVFFNTSVSNYPAEYQGRYFFVDYCNRWINMLDLSGEVTLLPFASDLDGNLSSIDVGNDGNLYYLSRSKEALFKIIYTNVDAPVITNQPTDITVPEGQSASFSVSASGMLPLSYQWQKNGTNISGATASTFTISNVILSDAGNYRVVVSNVAGSVTSNAASLTVSEFNATPVLQIITPVAGTLYQAGSTISFSGDATDEEDGALPPSAFTWEVVFHHDTHTHDGDVIIGAKSGSFEIPSVGETSSNVWYRLYLTVEDSEGLTTTIYREIYPRKSTLGFATIPAGLTITLDGQPLNTPVSVVGVEGIERTLGVLSPQMNNGKTYEFDRWEHGGGVDQTIVTPGDNATYTAVFNEVNNDLPAPWVHTDIGNVATMGNASFANGIFTVTGSGVDIWNNADEFHYVYQSMEGDGEIAGQVISITNTDRWAKAGFMIREALTTNARHASIFLTPSEGVAFQRRTSEGSNSSHTGTAGVAPVWLKLTRSGNTFTGYKSADGNNWQEMGSVTMALSSKVHIGMAVTAHNDGALNTTPFAQVTIDKSSEIIKNFYLVDAKTNLDIRPIENGEVINISGLVDKLDIRIEADDSKFKSLGIELTGSITRESYENYAPYSVFGDRNGEYSGINFIPGKYTLTVTPYSEIRRRGKAGTPVSLNFEIVTSSKEISLALAEENLSFSTTIDQQVSDGNQSAWITQMAASTRYVTAWANIEVYPNPTDNLIYVTKKVTEKTEFQILDIHGKRISSSMPTKNSGGKLQLDVAHLKDGWYILMIKDEYQILFKKFIVQHR